jgi:large subunit ribosomal protein L2
MPIKLLKPTSNARRNMSLFVGAKGTPKHKSLLETKVKSSGRNNTGRITVERRGGGSKRKVRLLDFSVKDTEGQKLEVVGIEYDPNRNGSLALLKSGNGVFRYIVAPEKIKIGQSIEFANATSIKPGNRMMIKNIPPSTQISCIETRRGFGAVLVKAAGSYATLMGFDNDMAIVRLPSGETRKINSNLYASVGSISNPEHSKMVLGKAGKVRRMGMRPNVRGKAKNPCDHPHGGGEGGTSIGLKRPKTPWGMPALGKKTRSSNKYSNSMILNKGKK